MEPVSTTQPRQLTDEGVPRVAPLPQARCAWKRVTDLVLSLTFLALTFPLFILIAVLVKVTSKGPIVYRAKRVGLGGETFCMYKFRSMYIDADQRLKDLWSQNKHEGPVFKMENDPRVTPIGRFLRRFSLDELPQFLNVVRGEMSLVGPRALHTYEVAEFDDYALQRLRVKPGITCYWQVAGRSNLTFEQWMELDNRYIDEFGFWTDIRILIRTPAAVLRAEGAY